MNTISTINKCLDEMSIKELLEEAMKELQEIKRILGIDNKMKG